MSSLDTRTAPGHYPDAALQNNRDATILRHPALRQPLHDREALVAELLLARARELARALELTDVPGVLGSASSLAALCEWEAANG